jgi:hypothetical protein
MFNGAAASLPFSGFPLWAYRPKIREGALEQAGLSQFTLQEGFNPDGQKFAAKQQKVIWQMCLPCEEVRSVILESAQIF